MTLVTLSTAPRGGVAPQRGDRPFLTIVIPAYNEERRLPPSLAKVAAYLRAQPYGAEVLVVENGSTDATSAAVERFNACLLYTSPSPRD